MNLNLEPLPRVTIRQVIRRGLNGTCPNCGRTKIFRSLVRIHHRCPSCGMTLERGDGYFLGPLCINYGVVAFGFVAPVLIAGFADWIALRFALALSLFGALVLPILFYRYSWFCWLTIYYICLPGELHANRSPDSDDLSFEEEERIP
ncbi:MAG: DUF983 domain-containing protein [Verrucomicrobiota bacterium]